MAQTGFSTSNALTKKAWDEKLFRDMVKESFFMGGGFAGESSSNIVHVKTQLEKGKGDKINFGLRMRLTGSGVTSGQILEGNEEALSTYDASVNLEQYRHAVRDNGEMTRKRAMFDIDGESEQALKDWGSEKIDQLCFDALFNAPTAVAYRDGGATGAFTLGTSVATAKAALSATYKINVAFIAALATAAKTGKDRTFIPLRPIKYKGKEYFVLLVHPDVGYDLKQDSVLQASWQNAMERGDDNPLFRDAICMWDGVVVKTHENCTLFSNGGGGSVKGAVGALLGAQALVWAWGKRPTVVQKKFDYDDQNAYAWGFIAGVAKPVFNSQDYGSIAVYLPRTGISS